MIVGRWLADRARNTPSRVAIDFDGRLVTYAELDAGADAYAAAFAEAGLRMFVENSLGERGVRELPELAEEIFRYRLGHAPTVEAWAAQAAAGATYDNDARVGGIDVPTLVLHGGADVVVEPRNAEVLGGLIPGARVEVVPDRGHLMIWEDSERVAELVTEFLS